LIDDIIINKEPFDRLTKIIKQEPKKCIAIIGSGFSIPQYPDWPGLVASICEKCSFDIRNLPDEIRNDKLRILEEVKKSSDKNYFMALKNIFIEKHPLNKHDLLKKIHFRTLLTFNYDLLIEKAIEVDGGCTFYSFPHLPVHKITDQKTCNIFHLHGSIDNVNDQQSIILTSSEYEEAYMNSILTSFLTQIFTYFHVCFLGCSLNDPYILKILLFCKRIQTELLNSSNSPKPDWFLILEENEVKKPPFDPVDYGVTIIGYRKNDDFFSGFEDVLKYWTDYTQAKKAIPYEEDLYKDNSEPTYD
jgi:hypothetical protein